MNVDFVLILTILLVEKYLNCLVINHKDSLVKIMSFTEFTKFNIKLFLCIYYLVRIIGRYYI